MSKTDVYHKLTFVRFQPDDLCVGHMEIWTIKNSSSRSAFESVQAALTQWIATTDSGRKAYGDYEEFNFGDLLNAEPWTERSFMVIAKKYGIKKLRAFSLSITDAAEDWDDRLVDHEEIKIGWAGQGVES